MTGRTKLRTLTDVLARGADEDVALGAVDRAGASYAQLRAHIHGAAEALRDLGQGPSHTAAIVLPNGPELAAAFLASAIAGTSAPLNPSYTRAEFDFYLGDLDARLLLISEGLDSPARDVARARGIAVIEVGTSAGVAGCFTLDGRLPGKARGIRPKPSATALLLHTSGTTSRPKMVPLSHANLGASAGNVVAALSLTPEDRCLNVMPLFHIHGLVAALLGSLAGGGTVVCAPGFLAPQFFPWLRECGPTWYTAVPSIHHSVLMHAHEPAAREALRHSRLRLVRSSSAALPVQTLRDLEATFGVPVIEAYGMTEAAHQMASNPLPPAPRRPGSVGPAAGPRIAIMNAEGALLPPGKTGEVVIQGPNVTSGYLSNPEANAQAFADGWFRTGDEGFLGDDGFLTLTGRLKEQINRGGEKIAPLEVEGVLCDHPAVDRAVCFAVPHPMLGEDIGAAVVLKVGTTAREIELREFVATRLAYFKVPRQIQVVDTIPLGPTGKVQRIGLAERLGVSAQVPVDDEDVTPARTPAEEIVAMCWAEVLGVATPGVRRNFFARGGDSILAIRLVARLHELLAVEVPLLAFFDAPTVEGIAATVDQRLGLEGSAGVPPAAP